MVGTSSASILTSPGTEGCHQLAGSQPPAKGAQGVRLTRGRREAGPAGVSGASTLGASHGSCAPGQGAERLGVPRDGVPGEVACPGSGVPGAGRGPADGYPGVPGEGENAAAGVTRGMRRMR